MPKNESLENIAGDILEEIDRYLQLRDYPYQADSVTDGDILLITIKVIRD